MGTVEVSAEFVRRDGTEETNGDIRPCRQSRFAQFIHVGLIFRRTDEVECNRSSTVGVADGFQRKQGVLDFVNAADVDNHPLVRRTGRVFCRRRGGQVARHNH